MLAACMPDQRTQRDPITSLQQREGGASSAPLELVQVAQVALPESVSFIDARIHQTGSILAWGSGRGVWLFRHGSWQRLGYNIAQAAGARFAVGDSVVEVIDRARAAVVTVGANGGYRTRYSFQPNHLVESATPVTNGWYVLGTNTDGDFVATRLWVDDQRSDSRVVWARGTSAKVYSARVSEHNGEALIAEYDSPFRVQRLGPDSLLRDFPALPETLLSQLNGGDAARWGALSVVPIREGEFVQSFTDLRSDQRMLVLRDRSGRFDRAKTLSAPLSILDFEPRSGQVLSARRSTRTEFVIYEIAPLASSRPSERMKGDSIERRRPSAVRP
jgi:hypothetical protein